MNSFEQLRKPLWYVMAPGELSNKISRRITVWNVFESKLAEMERTEKLLQGRATFRLEECRSAVLQTQELPNEVNDLLEVNVFHGVAGLSCTRQSVADARELEFGVGL